MKVSIKITGTSKVTPRIWGENVLNGLFSFVSLRHGLSMHHLASDLWSSCFGLPSCPLQVSTPFPIEIINLRKAEDEFIMPMNSFDYSNLSKHQAEGQHLEVIYWPLSAICNVLENWHVACRWWSQMDCQMS